MSTINKVKLFLTGSKAFGLTTTHDIDYIAFGPKEEIEHLPRAENEVPIHYIYYTKKRINDILANTQSYSFLLSIFFDYRRVGKDFPIYYDYLEHKNDIITALKAQLPILENEINSRIRKFIRYDKQTNSLKLTKLLDLIVANIYFIQNNKVELLPEQLKNLQELHDGKKDLNYLATIITDIKNLEVK